MSPERLVFKPSVAEQLGHYVYFLQDPGNDEIFYIGTGTGNRVFDHLRCAIADEGGAKRLNRIKEICNSNNTVKHYILRHGLSQETAFEIEAALIDFVGMEKLCNLQSGHYSRDFGLRTCDEISAQYDPEDLETGIPLLLININKLYKRTMTDEELYDSTRKSWVVGERRNKAKFAITTYRGLTREVYEIHKWFPVDINGKKRWGFEGAVAEDKIRGALQYKSILRHYRKGSANPIKYLNC